MCELDYLSWLELGGSCVRDQGCFLVWCLVIFIVLTLGCGRKSQRVVKYAAAN